MAVQAGDTCRGPEKENTNISSLPAGLCPQGQIFSNPATGQYYLVAMAENEERKAHSQWVSELPSGSEVAPPHHNQRDRWPPGSGLIPVTWWWWWEIGASAISIVSMVLLLALLFSIDRTRVDSWGLKIRPNSLISLSTTAARTAMMVSVTSCISQLKWRHYLRGPDRLHYLQIFDDASRGPWGALVALLTLRTKTPAIMALAAVTLVSLAVEPMAQQILDISEDRIPLGNDTAKVAVADSYISASLLPDGQSIFILLLSHVANILNQEL